MTRPTKFKDLNGREWALGLNVQLAQDIRKACPDVDFLNAHNGKAFQALGASDELLVQVLWLMCESQAEKLQVTPEDFAAGLAGDHLDAAEEALETAVILFTRPARRPVMELMLGKAKETTSKAMALAEKKVGGETFDRLQAEMLETLDRRMDEMMAQASTAKSSPTSGPALPESIHVHTH